MGTSTHWSTVVAGRYHSGATQDDGSLWTWGCNGSGQLGLGRHVDEEAAGAGGQRH